MYDTTLSKLLVQTCELTCVQYQNGTPPSKPRCPAIFRSQRASTLTLPS